MKVTIEPTDRFYMVGEVPVRLWQGTDEAGSAVVALVAGVGLTPRSAAPVKLVSIPPPNGAAQQRDGRTRFATR